MTLIQHSASNHWFERASEFDSADHPIRAFLQLNDAGELIVATTGPEDAICVDWHGDEVEAEGVLLSPALRMISSGGRIVVSDTGTPAAILVDDGSGGLVASTDLTQAEAGRFYQSVNGRIIAARFDAQRIQFIQSGDVIATTL